MFARAAASVLLAGAVVLGTAGCNFLSPQRTLEIDNPDNKVSATVGDVSVINAFALASEDGTTLSLLFTISNSDSRGKDVNLQYTADGAKVTEEVFVNGGETKTFGFGDAAQFIVTGADVEPGGSFALFVQWGTETGDTILLPVHDAALPEYAGLVPTPAPAEPTVELQEG